jgi:hypothetical protein
MRGPLKSLLATVLGIVAAAPLMATEQAPNTGVANFQHFSKLVAFDNKCPTLNFAERSQVDDLLFLAERNLPRLSSARASGMEPGPYYDLRDQVVAELSEPVEAEVAALSCDQSGAVLNAMRIQLTARIVAHALVADSDFQRLASPRQFNLAQRFSNNLLRAFGGQSEGPLQQLLQEQLSGSGRRGESAARYSLELIDLYRADQAVLDHGFKIHWNEALDGWVLHDRETGKADLSRTYADPKMLFVIQRDPAEADSPAFTVVGEVVALPERRPRTLRVQLLPGEAGQDISQIGIKIAPNAEGDGDGRPQSDNCLAGARCFVFSDPTNDLIRNRVSRTALSIVDGIEVVVHGDLGEGEFSSLSDLRRQTKPGPLPEARLPALRMITVR